MADFNPINYVGFQDPAAAIKLQQQQALAAQLMAQGEQRQDINNTIGNGPYAQVAPYSPLEGLSKAISKGLGAYAQSDANEKLAKALAGPTQAEMMGNATNSAIQGEGGMGPATKDDVAAKLAQQMMPSAPSDTKGMNPTEMRQEMFLPGMGKAAYEARLKDAYAGSTRAAETSNTPYQTPQGTYEMGSQIMGAKPSVSNDSPLPPALPADKAAQIDSLYGSGAESPAKPVNLIGANEKSEALTAADGKPLLAGLTNIPAPDPTGTPKFKTENTKTGVEQTIQDQKDAAEGNKAFATTAQSLGQEKARLDNLIQVYKDVQSGTLTAQNPELFNKLAALGFNDSPDKIKDLAGIQNATQNHILQVIQQIKDTTANAGGGAPTRVFGSEISQLLENGESTKGQPEALWNVIGQAKGVVDHHLDMVNGWNKIGGLGNRAAGGYTMRPDDFAQQFSTNHNISDYRDKALKEIGPFKGMAGNMPGSPSIDSYKTPEDIGTAFKSGKITRDQAAKLLQENHGYAP